MPKPNERPTTPPSFDPIQYARNSDARIKTDVPRSERRLTRRALPTIDDETWARGIGGNPFIAMPAADLRGLPLDHRAGFLLSLMDGTLDLESAASRCRPCLARRLPSVPRASSSRRASSPFAEHCACGSCAKAVASRRLGPKRRGSRADARGVSAPCPCRAASRGPGPCPSRRARAWTSPVRRR